MTIHVAFPDHRPRSAMRAHHAALAQPIPAAARTRIEHAIEAHLAAANSLITLLDRFDGDPDFEPSNGSSNGWGGQMDQSEWAAGNRDDFEQDADDELAEIGNAHSASPNRRTVCRWDALVQAEGGI